MCSWRGGALFSSLSATHLPCVCLQLTWPTSNLISCSIKAWSSSPVCCLSGHSVLGPLKLCIFFLPSALFCYFFGVWIMNFVLQPRLNCTLSLSMSCQDSQSDLVLISFPQPIGPGSFSVTEINVVFPGQQSFSVLFVFRLRFRPV